MEAIKRDLQDNYNLNGTLIDARTFRIVAIPARVPRGRMHYQNMTIIRKYQE